MPLVPAINQKDLPIVLTLFSNSVAGALSVPGTAIPIVTVFGGPSGIVRPESISMARPARGTVSNTIGAAFLDDFGEGIGVVTLQGHTGWQTGGLSAFSALKLTFTEYLARRKALREAGEDPNAIQLWYIDTLNLEAFSVYPVQFSLERTRNRSLLYFYRIQLLVLTDLLQQLTAKVGDPLSKGQGTSIINGLQGLVNTFLTTVTNLPG